MKKLILTPVTVLVIALTAFAQRGFLTSFSIYPPPTSGQIHFSVHPRYDRPVYKERLEKAKLVSDLVDYFPGSWIDEYVSLEIVGTSNGKAMHAVSANDRLTAEQKNILKGADLFSDIVINVKYKRKNAVTHDLVDQEINMTMEKIHIQMTVIPETEAQYVGGEKQMTAYLKESVMDKIPEPIAKYIELAQVLFTVNENGEIENAKIYKTSGDQKTDQLLVDAINKMSKWKPAETAKGIKVKQEFRFSVSKDGC